MLKILTELKITISLSFLIAFIFILFPIMNVSSVIQLLVVSLTVIVRDYQQLHQMMNSSS